ncbi:MAG: DegT/DnrJ/EryC1/StrS family aminotransferase [Chloroflexi bacterium]|nr:DegT/DnrJ/EryC1/StrS family aminotransferase [Chloroflexota bacterium]
MAQQTVVRELAVNGGTPVRDIKQRPFPRWPVFWDDEKQAVQAVLDSGHVNYWTGEMGRQFQTEFAAYMGVNDAIAVNSGTSALHVAMAAAGIEPGDEVIVPARSFIATASAVTNQFAVPVFADIDPDTHTISVDSVAEHITSRTAAVIPVHLAGLPADMDALLGLARQRGLAIVEDCAQAHGATYRDKRVGSFGTVNAWSFCQDKIFTTGGEGGMVGTDDAAAAEVARSFRDHGFHEAERRSALARGALNQYTHHRVGFNYRMTEMQSAIGLKALARLDWHLQRRRANAHYLTDGLEELDEVLSPAPETPESAHAFYCYYVTLNLTQLNCSRDEFVRAVQAEGVRAARGTSAELYREPVYQDRVGYGSSHHPFESTDYGQVECPNAKDIGQRSLRLEVFPTLQEEDLDDVLDAIGKVAAAFRV